MDLKQRKTIFWSVVLTTFFISNSLTIWWRYGEIFEEGIWNGIGVSIMFSITLLSLPSVIFYRVLIGRIPVDNNIGFYYLFILMLGTFSFGVLIRRFGEYISNPPKEIIFLVEIIILVYLIHKIMKQFIFNFKKGEDQNQ